MLSLKDFLGMSPALRIAVITTIGMLFVQPSYQQTYSGCNPTLQANCPSDPALGRSVSIDFTSGASSEFTAQGNPTYSSEGVSFTVSEAGDAPQLISNWYIMFGKYEITMKAAPGAGIVSSSVLLSNDLDEIDWEWLGAQDGEVQTNYFGKGQTTTYDRATVVDVSDTQGSWHTYTVEWTDSQIVWSVDGSTVRTLQASDASGMFPQTPCQLKFGSWSGGSPGNPAGTISWAQGPTDFSNGPFTMVVSSISVVDYSTGSSYSYGNESGAWASIESDGGRVNGNVGGSIASSPDPTTTGSLTPAWAPAGTSATVSFTSYPGLPSGWSVNPTTGKVIPPSAASGIEVPLRLVYIFLCGFAGVFLFGMR